VPSGGQLDAIVLHGPGFWMTSVVRRSRLSSAVVRRVGIASTGVDADVHCWTMRSLFPFSRRRWPSLRAPVLATGQRWPRLPLGAAEIPSVGLGDALGMAGLTLAGGCASRELDRSHPAVRSGSERIGQIVCRSGNDCGVNPALKERLAVRHEPCLWHRAGPFCNRHHSWQKRKVKREEPA
jgi:hypothetical protein